MRAQVLEQLHDLLRHQHKQRVERDHVRALQQRRVSPTERQVLVVAEAGASKVPSAYVTVRKGPDGWAAVS